MVPMVPWYPTTLLPWYHVPALACLPVVLPPRPKGRAGELLLWQLRAPRKRACRWRGGYASPSTVLGKLRSSLAWLPVVLPSRPKGRPGELLLCQLRE